MGSRIFLLLGLSIAFVLLITSEVAARDLPKPTQNNLKTSSLQFGEGGSWDGGDRPPWEVSGSVNGGGGHYHGGGKLGDECSFVCQYTYKRCCSAAEAQALKNTQIKPHN
ncbi:hypothetical protein AgCh_003064 [Apium graveolens]